MDTISLDGDPEVGRKKAAPAPAEPTSIQVRGSREWIAYVHAWADEDYRSPASLFEKAVAALAKAEGRADPPKR